MRQVSFVIVYVVLGIVAQSLLFKTEANTWLEAWKTWPWLWLLYFAGSHFLVERLWTHKRED
jgi:hypothetical protein